jgi:hypothetical protein
MEEHPKARNWCRMGSGLESEQFLVLVFFLKFQIHKERRPDFLKNRYYKEKNNRKKPNPRSNRLKQKTSFFTSTGNLGENLFF